MLRGEYELALRGYTRAIAEVGLSGPVIGGLGAANLQLNRNGQARMILERGTRIEPQSVSVWNNLGIALAQAGERRAARDALTLARMFAPPGGRSRAGQSSSTQRRKNFSHTRYGFASRAA